MLDLSKIRDYGKNILKIENSLEETFEKMQRNYPDIPKVLRNYGKYLIEICNDKERGEKLLER